MIKTDLIKQCAIVSLCQNSTFIITSLVNIFNNDRFKLAILYTFYTIL